MTLSRCALFLFCLAALIPWAVLQWDMSVNGDTAWLMHAAGEFLAGHSMTDRFFDNNPPMSYMIYVPMASLAAFDIPLWYAPVIITLPLIALSLGVSAYFLSRWPGMSHARIAGVMAIYAGVITLVSQYEFAQKDHLIAVALFPFMLAQYSLNNGYRVNKALTYATIAAGVPFILLKPHYGLLPVLLILQRMAARRDIRAFAGFDFFALAAGVILYVLAIYIWFPDFVSVVLPVSMDAYVSGIMPQVLGAGAGLSLLAACMLVGALCIGREDEGRGHALFFTVMTFAAIIAFMVQMKGFGGHMIPVLAFALPALYLVASAHIGILRRGGAGVVATAIAAVFYLAFPLNPGFPTHDDYAESSLARLIKEKGDGTSFYMQSDSTNIVYPLSLYLGQAHASRFPNIWALYGNEGAREEIAALMRADIEGYKPGIILLYEPPPQRADMHALLGQALADYTPGELVSAPNSEYFAGTAFSRRDTIPYRVYVRKSR